MSNDRPRIISPTRDYFSSIIHSPVGPRTVSRSLRLPRIRRMIGKLRILNSTLVAGFNI